MNINEWMIEWMAWMIELEATIITLNAGRDILFNGLDKLLQNAKAKIETDDENNWSINFQSITIKGLEWIVIVLEIDVQHIVKKLSKKTVRQICDILLHSG